MAENPGVGELFDYWIVASKGFEMGKLSRYCVVMLKIKPHPVLVVWCACGICWSVGYGGVESLPAGSCAKEQSKCCAGICAPEYLWNIQSSFEIVLAVTGQCEIEVFDAVTQKRTTL